MVGKSDRAIAAKTDRREAAAAKSDSATQPTPSVGPVSSLSPKSCLTCGRVITPRAKWSKDWANIKYCSDRCRSSRPGKLVATLRDDTTEELVALVDQYGVEGVTRTDDGQIKIDVETFVESVILRVAATQEGGKKTLEDVEEEIKRLCGQTQARSTTESLPNSQDESMGDNSSQQASESAKTGVVLPGEELWKVLDSPPGFRERIRRAARRLALGITYNSSSPGSDRDQTLLQTLLTTTERGKIELSQNGRRLNTVQDLSFAKGVIEIGLRRT